MECSFSSGTSSSLNSSRSSRKPLMRMSMIRTFPMRIGSRKKISFLGGRKMMCTKMRRVVVVIPLKIILKKSNKSTPTIPGRSADVERQEHGLKVLELRHRGDQFVNVSFQIRFSQETLTRCIVQRQSNVCLRWKR